MYDAAQKYIDKKNLGLVFWEKTDDGTIVVFERSYGIDTSVTPPKIIEQPAEVIASATVDVIESEIASYETKVATLKTFLGEVNGR